MSSGLIFEVQDGEFAMILSGRPTTLKGNVVRLLSSYGNNCVV
jgi:hypothetical protein